MRVSALCLVGLLLGGPSLSSLEAKPLSLVLRSRQEVGDTARNFRAVSTTATWEPHETAIVVCDMWDAHTCPNAAQRVAQMAPRMNEVLKAARSKGVFIIHAPSNTMKFYENHPGRKLAQSAPRVEPLKPLQNWCYLDKDREGALPIDDSDGGCDCETTWKRGDPYPWTRQIATIEIADGDAITDSEEAYFLLKQRGIKNLIVMGVHTNMCVLGRPFSIRQMVYQGLNVALMRDMTDTMYNPAKSPFVSHFTGTDLVVEHIERYWCPTLTSGQFLDGKEYRFPADTRPHVVMLLGEDEYQTAKTLPKFAAEQLGKNYRISFVHLDQQTKASFPGIDVVRQADILLISARRRPLPAQELDILKAYVASGKPVVGIRTASHAFHLRNQPAPTGLADWPDLDATVFGGNYSNHHGHQLKSVVHTLPEQQSHPLLKDLPATEFPGAGGLYQTSPLKPGAVELMRGRVAGIEQAEPVAWLFSRADGGQSFYTSLGHPDDFERPELPTLLKNVFAFFSQKGAIADKSPEGKAEAAAPFVAQAPAETVQVAQAEGKPNASPRLLKVPGTWNELDPALKDYDGFAWYRCTVQIPENWAKRSLYLYVEKVDNACETFLNGVKIGVSGKFPPEYESGLFSNEHRYVVPPDLLKINAPNVVAIRVYDHDGNAGFKGMAPQLLNGAESISLAGDWEFQTGDHAAWAEEVPQGLKPFTTVGPAPQLGRFATVIRRQAQDKPLTPQQSHDLFKVPDDLQVDIVLTEPVISQPLFLNFDERGRMWVLNYLQYPEPAGLKLLSKDQWWRAVYDKVPLPPPHGDKGADKITIHEDTDGDGTFDSHKTFVDGLNIATAFAQGRGGVYVLNPPYLLFYPDKNHDDIPDSDPEVLLEGFGIEDTHSVINSLRFGPDGWLYGAQGSTVTGAVRRPGQKQVIRSQGQNIWRFHPESKTYEIFAEGGGNAFSVEIDAQGRIFSGHNGGNTRGFHYQQGAYLQKGFGKHGPLSNPYAFGYFPAMEHGDYARFTHNFAVYEGDSLPAKYQGVIFGVNPINSHVVMSERMTVGSTFKTRDLGFAIESSDSWFRPVDIKDGPDGNLYVADWYDGQLAHTANYQGGMDRDHGRIYRIRPRQPVNKSDSASRIPAAFVESSKGTPATPQRLAELTGLLQHPNRWHRQTALRLLGDQASQPALQKPLQEALAGTTMPEPVEILWALHASGNLTPEIIRAALTHANPAVRTWVWRLPLDRAQEFAPAVAQDFLQRATQEDHIDVLCQIASATQRLRRSDQAIPLLQALMTRSQYIDDPRLPLLVWWGLESKITKDPQAVLALFENAALWREPMVEKEILPRLMRRFAATGQRADLTVCTVLLKKSPTKETTAALMRGFEEAFQGRSMNNVPPELVAALSAAGGGSLSLKIRQGDKGAIAEALQVLQNEKAPPAKRTEYATLFGEVSVPDVVPLFLTIVAKTNDDQLRSVVLSSLPTYNNPEIASTVLQHYREWNDDIRSVAQSLLSSRKAWAIAFLKAIDQGQIAASSVPLETVRSLTIHSDPAIADLVKKHWGEVEGASTGDMQAELQRMTAALNAGGGDPYPGKALYRQTCGKCHALHGDGGQIGPDLTTFKRDDLRSMLLNVVNPSAEIREGFETHIVIMDDGRVVQGFLIEQDPQVTVLRSTEGQTVSLEKEAMEDHIITKKSLMPEGQLKGFSDQQIRDLFAYLRSTQPLSD